MKIKPKSKHSLDIYLVKVSLIEKEFIEDMLKRFKLNKECIKCIKEEDKSLSIKLIELKNENLRKALIIYLSQAGVEEIKEDSVPWLGISYLITLSIVISLYTTWWFILILIITFSFLVYLNKKIESLLKSNKINS